MSLYLKYRPKTLKEFQGNTSMIESLETVLSKPIEELPHAFLFTGNSGCGKTTLARIVSTHLNCSDYDFKESNSADFTGIDFVRSIIRNMMLKPLKGGVRVWLIDECHQLSKDAQSALLKALEDTPAHVYFILATTDPQKLLKTIQNRCMTFNVQSLPDNQMLRLFKNVLRQEKKTLSDNILDSIIQNSLGSPRAGLVILDKVIDLPEDKIIKVIDEVARQENETIELCCALIGKSNWKKVSEILKGLSEQEPESVRRAVLRYFSVVLLNQGSMQAFEVMECFKNNYYDNARAGLILSCYEACLIKK